MLKVYGQTLSHAASREHLESAGFTLIELAIVLLVIGLIIGGILVGQDLIRAGQVRATISQVEKYNQAVETFRGKYGYLPGDIKDPEASSFGFQPRGPYPGQGDGNGIIAANGNNSASGFGDYLENAGEAPMVWVDLSQAGLIDGYFVTASETTIPGILITASSSPSLAMFLPEAKLGQGNYIYVYSRGWGNNTGLNSFGMSAVTQIGTGLLSTPGLTVKQAYDIDKKIDDGLPQSGNVMALYLTSNYGFASPVWAGTTASQPPYTSGTGGSSSTCFDNGNSTGTRQHYSIEISNGTNVNCALSFRFQ